MKVGTSVESLPCTFTHCHATTPLPNPSALPGGSSSAWSGCRSSPPASIHMAGHCMAARNALG